MTSLVTSLVTSLAAAAAPTVALNVALTVVLLVSALLFGGPAMLLLARLPGARRTPVATLICWQLLAVASVESAVLGSMMAARSVWESDQHRLLTIPLAVGAALVGGHVLVALLVQGRRIGRRLRRIRRRQRDVVDLTATLVGQPLQSVRVVELDAPLAYCVPGWRGAGRVVLSQGALDRLDEEQVAAVLAHETAHLRWRHDLVVEAFTVLRAAAPPFVGAGRRALDEVSLLVEVLADRAAAAQVGVVPLIRAMRVSVEESLVVQEGGRPDESLSPVQVRVDLLDASAVRPSAHAMVALNVGLATWILTMFWCLSTAFTSA